MNEHYPMTAATWDQSETEPPVIGVMPAANETQDAEHDAILTGIFAGEFALEQSRRSGVLKLFAKDVHVSLSSPKLLALRTYAEFRRVFIGKDHRVPTASLLALGYTPAQIFKFDASIVGWPETSSAASSI